MTTPVIYRDCQYHDKDWPSEDIDDVSVNTVYIETGRNRLYDKDREDCTRYRAASSHDVGPPSTTAVRALHQIG